MSQFCNFVNPITPGGGGDQAEDVMGGLNTALHLGWKASAVKVGIQKMFFCFKLYIIQVIVT